MKTIVCRVCEGDMKLSDIPRFEIYHCSNCDEIGQMVNKSIIPIGSLLDKHRLGDDRVIHATSNPHISTVKSFVDIFENATRFLRMDLAEASGGLKVILSMTENRIDSALQCFKGLDIASDEAAKGLAALREARELISASPKSTRGITLRDDALSALSPEEDR